MKKKLKLDSLQVKSFITEETDVNAETVKGGTIVIPIDTNFGPQCIVLNTQFCVTRNINQCNITRNVIQCGPPNTIIVGCNQVSVNICIVPTVVGPFC